MVPLYPLKMGMLKTSSALLQNVKIFKGLSLCIWWLSRIKLYYDPWLLTGVLIRKGNLHTLRDGGVLLHILKTIRMHREKTITLHRGLGINQTCWHLDFLTSSLSNHDEYMYFILYNLSYLFEWELKWNRSQKAATLWNVWKY